MPEFEYTELDHRPNEDLPNNYKDAAEQLLGKIEWINETEGFCQCPGVEFHTTDNKRKDCKIMIDGAPTIKCQHSSCNPVTFDYNRKIRSLFGRIDKANNPSGNYRPSNIVPFNSPSDIADNTAKALRDRLHDISKGRLCDTPSPIPDTVKGQFHAHLSLFEDSEWIWHGDTYNSTAAHIRPAKAWRSYSNPIGQFISHSSFKPDSEGRKNENIDEVKYLVAESDDLTKEQQMGIFAYFRDWCGWDLRMVIDTGGKSLHAWFHWPDNLNDYQIKAILKALDCDEKLLTPSQPSRVAGAKRDDKRQAILWFSATPSETKPKTFEEICQGKVGAITAVWGQSNRPSSFDDAKLARPEVIIEGLLYHRSKLIIGGVAKAGKSYFSMKMAYAIATGTPFLRWANAKPRKVLYVDFELHEWELNERCSAVCNWIVPDCLGTVSLRRHHFVRDPVSLGKVLHDQAVGCDVIILDCLYKFNSAEDENDNAAMKHIGAWMDGIIEATGAAIILVHHFGKGSSEGRDSIDRFRGASSIVGEMDAILAIGSHEEDRHFIITTTARSFAPTEPFVAHWDFPHWVEAPDKDASKAAKPGRAQAITDDAILKAMPKGPENARRFEDLHISLQKRRFTERIKDISGISDCFIQSESGQKVKGYFRWQ
jgi:hypothetical protein